jgi:hypothetical protein
MPLAAREGRTQAWIRGVGAVWRSAGFVYRSGPQAIASHAGAVEVGPHGAVLLGDDARWTWFAPPGRSPRRIDVARHPWGTRWADDGGNARFVAPGDEPRWVDLLGATGPGLPADGEGLTWDGHVRGLHAAEATCACDGRYLAGPAGRVWDLRTLSSSADEGVRFGVTVRTAAGWVSLDWESGEGFVLAPDGRILADVHGPPDLATGWWDEDGVAVETLDGDRLRLDGAAPRSEPPTPPDAHGVDGFAFVGSAPTPRGTAWWTADGLLAIGER